MLWKSKLLSQGNHKSYGRLGGIFWIFRFTQACQPLGSGIFYVLTWILRGPRPEWVPLLVSITTVIFDFHWSASIRSRQSRAWESHLEYQLLPRIPTYRSEEWTPWWPRHDFFDLPPVLNLDFLSSGVNAIGIYIRVERILQSRPHWYLGRHLTK